MAIYAAILGGLWLSITCLAITSVSASQFDQCVLDVMKGVTSDIAAVSIKEACIRKTEVPIPTSLLLSGLPNSRASYGAFVDGSSGLFVTINNNTGYTISELTITVANKKNGHATTYTKQLFVSPNAVSTADRTVFMLIGPGMRIFMVNVSETAKDQKDFFENYGWDIVSGKGIPP
jgi:hypothetical protein